MTREWFQGRQVSTSNETSKALRVFLSPDEWAVFDGLAKEDEISRAHMAKRVIRGWLKRNALERESQKALAERFPSQAMASGGVVE